MILFTKTLPKCKSVTPWCMFVQLVVEWARATAVAWEQSQFYCFYCCSPPLRHHHRQHHHQHHRQLLFKLSLSCHIFFSLSSSSWPGKNPSFTTFIVVFLVYSSIASSTILPHPQIAQKLQFEHNKNNFKTQQRIKGQDRLHCHNSSYSYLNA